MERKYVRNRYSLSYASTRPLPIGYTASSIKLYEYKGLKSKVYLPSTAGPLDVQQAPVKSAVVQSEALVRGLGVLDLHTTKKHPSPVYIYVHEPGSIQVASR